MHTHNTFWLRCINIQARCRKKGVKLYVDGHIDEWAEGWGQVLRLINGYNSEKKNRRDDDGQQEWHSSLTLLFFSFFPVKQDTRSDASLTNRWTIPPFFFFCCNRTTPIPFLFDVWARFRCRTIPISKGHLQSSFVRKGKTCGTNLVADQWAKREKKPNNSAVVTSI